MLKMSQNTRQTSSTLNIAGIAWIRAFTTTWKRKKAMRIFRDFALRYCMIKLFVDIASFS